MLRVIATDLDGTLLASDRTISERTLAAIAKAEDAGVTVIFVTGRPLRWARQVFEHVGPHGVAIIANGALVWDVVADQALEINGIAPDVGLPALAELRRAIPGTAYALETLAGIRLEPHFMERYPIPSASTRGPVEELFDCEAFKILARHEDLEAADFWDQARAAIGDRLEITWSSQGALLEMSAFGVTKASTLARWCESHGIGQADVVAFGDMPNDLDMLRWAGTSYAVANAHPSVIEAASHLTASNDDDGVAQVIEGLI